MDTLESLLYENLILLDYKADSKEELLRNLAAILEDLGFVKESYGQAIIDRENHYPTGLNTLGVKVAMPHTDPIHVHKPAILVAKLTHPIVFKEMGNGVNDVEASLIFMLAITNPERHVTTLGKLMSIFSDKDSLVSLYEAPTKVEVMQKLNTVLA